MHRIRTFIFLIQLALWWIGCVSAPPSIPAHLGEHTYNTRNDQVEVILYGLDGDLSDIDAVISLCKLFATCPKMAYKPTQDYFWYIVTAIVALYVLRRWRNAQ